MNRTLTEHDIEAIAQSIIKLDEYTIPAVATAAPAAGIGWLKIPKGRASPFWILSKTRRNGRACGYKGSGISDNLKISPHLRCTSPDFRWVGRRKKTL